MEKRDVNKNNPVNKSNLFWKSALLPDKIRVAAKNMKGGSF